MLGCPPCRDDPDAVVSFGVNDRQQHAFSGTDQDEAVLAIVLAVIEPLDGERAFENLDGRLKAYAVFGVIFGGLGLVPLEVVACRRYGLSVVSQEARVPRFPVNPSDAKAIFR
jgi:hypothetical protein